MENEMDKLVQEKNFSMEAIIVTTIPIVTTAVPSTSAIPFDTTLPTTLETTLVTESFIAVAHPSDEASKLIKAMHDMSIQTNEINRLKDQIKSLEDEKKLAQIMHKDETQKSNRLTERIQKLEKELTLKEPPAQEKQQLWANIINSVNDIWPSIQVIFEQKDLIKEATKAIQRVKEELGIKLEEANEIIKFLNSKNKQKLEDICISDRTETILEVNKVITKRNLMVQLEDKCQNMELAITRFMVKFDLLRQKGLPNPLVIIDRLMRHEDYDKKIREVAKEQTNSSTMKGIPTRKVLYQTFENLFYLHYEVKYLFINKPTFSKYTKADEIFKRMVKIKLLDAETWEKLND